MTKYMKFAIGCMLLAAAQIALAQSDYPNRPIRLITPAAPGGTTDILARLMGAKLSDVLKQQVIVDNRASASGVIAAEITANSPPDGYTLFVPYHQHTVNAALNPKLPYDAVNSFTPITQLTAAGLLLVVNLSSPPKNLKEFVEWTRSYKGALNFGSAGLGSGGHLAGQLYNIAAGVNAQHIPYKGAGPSLIDLIAGQYQYNFAGMQAAQTIVRAGKLRALAVTTARRWPNLPDLVTVVEAGVPGYEASNWYGLFGPAKMRAETVALLQSEIARIAKLEFVRERLVADGLEPVVSTAREFDAHVVREIEKWTKLAKAAKFSSN